MSIYSDHIDYAKKVRMPIRLAEIWCKNQLELKKEMDKAKKCPKCGKDTLELELGSYEEGYSDYVHCSNDEIPAVDVDGEEYFTECDYTASPEKGHEPLSAWYDFDVIMAFRCGMSGRVKEFGSLQEWLKFVREEVSKISIRETA